MKPTAEFDPKAAAKKLMREARSGALGTLMAGSGDPYCSLVNVASAADGSSIGCLASAPPPTTWYAGAISWRSGRDEDRDRWIPIIAMNTSPSTSKDIVC